MTKAYAHRFDEDIDYEEFNEKIGTKENIIELKSGVYIVKNFKKIPIKRVLNSSESVYMIQPYSGDGMIGILFFTGKIIFKNTEACETSQIGGDPVTFGKVPAGTLLIALDAD